MKAEEIKIGRTYAVQLKTGRAEVKITAVGKPGGWDGRNLLTDRAVHVNRADQILLDLDAAEAAEELVQAARAALKRKK